MYKDIMEKGGKRMNTIVLKAREIAVKKECDVLIAGGGTAGISAALAAARQGASVVLCEQEWALGGLATLGVVTVFLPLCDGRGTQHIFGIGEELLRLSITAGYEDRFPDAWLGDHQDIEKRKKQRFLVQFNPQMFAMAAEKLLLDAGVKILYGTKVIDLCTDGNRISTCILNNREGWDAVRVKTVIDCTGDGEVAFMSGEEMRTFTQNFASYWGYYSAYRGNGCDGYRIYSENFKDHRRYDGTKAEDLNDMMFFLHKKLWERTERVREQEGNPHIMPVTMQTIPPVRMSRCIVGAYTLDESEEGKKFPDSIGRTTDWRKPGPVFSVPYRTLYGKTENLLCAGRNISVTDDMWDITRCIPTCCVTGEGAGIAAALAAKQNKAVKNVDINTLQEILKQNQILVD
ncbi:MAG: FAD-dependent oxidoreductase [Ruminococcaceae bacterium]|nr:FAD-dependent oxidoreductase [Oscillospiraceae bacterium]